MSTYLSKGHWDHRSLSRMSRKKEILLETNRLISVESFIDAKCHSFFHSPNANISCLAGNSFLFGKSSLNLHRQKNIVNTKSCDEKSETTEKIHWKSKANGKERIKLLYSMNYCIWSAVHELTESSKSQTKRYTDLHTNTVKNSKNLKSLNTYCAINKKKSNNSNTSSTHRIMTAMLLREKFSSFSIRNFEEQKKFMLSGKLW